MTPEQSKVLYQIEQKLDDMHCANKREHKEIKDIIDGIQLSRESRERDCEKKFDERPKMTLFKWVIGGVFVTLFFIFGLVVNLDIKVDIIDDKFNSAYHQITGEPYNPIK